jgi:hypothetical protein
LQILGYGEDSLTLWALKHKMPVILHSLQDSTVPEDCLVFYRPSFGRRGGEGRAEFGEFDFILATKKSVYLGESKWDNLSSKVEPSLDLKNKQVRRHAIFSWYITNWLKHKPSDMAMFHEYTKEDFNNFGGLGEPLQKLAPPRSILAETLQGILNAIQAHIENSNSANLKNVMFYFYNKKKAQPLKEIDDHDDFQIINIDYSDHLKSGNLISI